MKYKNVVFFVAVMALAILSCIATLAIARSAMSSGQKFAALVPSSTPTQTWSQPLAIDLPTDTPVPPTAVPIIVVSTMTPTIAPTVAPSASNTATNVVVAQQPTVEPTQVPTVTVAPTETLAPTDTQVPIVDAGTTVKMGKWSVTYFTGATAQMKSWKFAGLEPIKVKDFPNVDIPSIGFKKADGLYYADEDKNYFQDAEGNVTVAPNSYRVATADYDVGFHKCARADTGRGCSIVFVNVSAEEQTNLEKVMVRNGYTVSGPYFNGDKLNVVIPVLLSKTTHDMLNMSPNGTGVNLGGNCAKAKGCKGTEDTFAIMSGNELLVLGVTTYDK